MGRLIDADALIELFKNLRDEHETNCISYNALYEVILQQKTAYDLEAVVAELEKEYDLADKEKARCMEENIFQYDEAKGYARGINTAISIVRGKE